MPAMTFRVRTIPRAEIATTSVLRRATCFSWSMDAGARVTGPLEQSTHSSEAPSYPPPAPTPPPSTTGRATYCIPFPRCRNWTSRLIRSPISRCPSTLPATPPSRSTPTSTRSLWTRTSSGTGRLLAMLATTATVPMPTGRTMPAWSSSSTSLRLPRAMDASSPTSRNAPAAATAIPSSVSASASRDTPPMRAKSRMRWLDSILSLFGIRTIGCSVASRRFDWFGVGRWT
mmetsp:Transcript_5317/g.15091  ORF Transcript_5317/g.15091 Transcript_5317/m.15091 type:complete len:230 (-) Transcript_5317:61-750(-)